MIAIPVTADVLRRTVRTALVAAITVAALGLSLPNLLALTNPFSFGWLDFSTSANIVAYTVPEAPAAGIEPGDRIDYSLMPPDERYGHPEDGLRMPPAGKTISFVVDRHGGKHVATLTAIANEGRIDWNVARSLLELTAQKAVFLVLVLLGSSLVLIRPRPLTVAFFLFVAGNGVMPFMYSFLPPAGYAAVMIVDDTLAALGAIGFLALAFYLDPPRQIRTRLAVGAAAFLFTVIVVPLATSDAFELLMGKRPAWPLAGWTSFLAVWLCYIAGVALLVRLIARARAPRSLGLLAGLLAAIGALTIIDWTLASASSAWYFANLPAVAMNRGVLATVPNASELPAWPVNALFILRLLGALLAGYVIVRAGVADTGPVFRRIVAYIIVALLGVSLFALANITLIPQFARYALIVPVEIFVAIAIGYWVSGLRDLARCLSLICADAWSAWAKGHAREERDALAQSLGLAKQTRRKGLIAEVRAQIAFSSWRDGDDAEFEQNVAGLRSMLNGRSMQGIRGFAHAAASEDCAFLFAPEDLAEWRSRAALVLCARTNVASRAQRFATDALASADRSGLPSLQVLASIAVAEVCPDQRIHSLERAHAIARDAGWPALSKSILALRANSRDIGILQSFVDIRLRKCRTADPTFRVSFFTAELCAGGTRVPLTEKQLELLLVVAFSATGINDRDLVDILWPESEGDAARNSLRVCLHGLRKNAGDARIVTRVGKGFTLHPSADVDLWRFQSLLGVWRDSGNRDRAQEFREMCDALRAGEGRRATLGDWFYRFEQTLNRRLDEAERLLARDVARGART